MYERPVEEKLYILKIRRGISITVQDVEPSFMECQERKTISFSIVKEQ